VDEQKIRFNQQGEVTAVYFKKGDEVKKGDIIAELDQSSVESSILQAEINLQNAQLQLDETVNGDRSAQILQAQNNLEQSKIKLDVAQKEYTNLLDTQSDSGTISDTETTMANARLDVQSYIVEGRRMLDQVKTIFNN
jgi:multidrug resistance efflux pump